MHNIGSKSRLFFGVGHVEFCGRVSFCVLACYRFGFDFAHSRLETFWAGCDLLPWRRDGWRIGVVMS